MMHLDELLKRLREERPQVIFDDDYDTSCPCFNGDIYVDDKLVRVAGHCWRVSDSLDDGYQDCEIVSFLPQAQTMALAKVIKEELDAQEWYNPYRVKVRCYVLAFEDVLE